MVQLTELHKSQEAEGHQQEGAGNGAGSKYGERDLDQRGIVCDVDFLTGAEAGGRGQHSRGRGARKESW